MAFPPNVIKLNIFFFLEIYLSLVHCGIWFSLLSWERQKKKKRKISKDRSLNILTVQLNCYLETHKKKNKGHIIWEWFFKQSLYLKSVTFYLTTSANNIKNTLVHLFFHALVLASEGYLLKLFINSKAITFTVAFVRKVY